MEKQGGPCCKECSLASVGLPGGPPLAWPGMHSNAGRWLYQDPRPPTHLGSATTGTHSPQARGLAHQRPHRWLCARLKGPSLAGGRLQTRPSRATSEPGPRSWAFPIHVGPHQGKPLGCLGRPGVLGPCPEQALRKPRPVTASGDSHLPAQGHFLTLQQGRVAI